MLVRYFKVLFPDWPDAKDMPSPCENSSASLIFLDITEDMVSVANFQAPDPLDRAYHLLAMTETERPRRQPAADVSQPMSPIHPTGPTPTLSSYTSPSQQESTHLNMGRYGIQTDQIPRELMGTRSDAYRYQEFPDKSPFQTNSASHNCNIFLNPPHSAMSISNANSSLVYVGYDVLDMPTEHTAYSGCNLTSSGQLGVMDGSGSLPPFDTQMAGSVPRHAQSAGHLGYESATTFSVGNQSTNPSYVGGSVPQGSQQPPRAASIIFRESDPRAGG